jgi:Protein of unknown function DUF111
VGETAAPEPSPAGIGAAGDETVVQIETTIDDMSPQLYEPLMERLLEAGALDVFLTPVIMKRSRPGVVLTALCAPDRVGEVSRLLFVESSTIGVRWAERRRARLVQGLEPRRARRDGHARVRRRRPHRPGEIAARARGARSGSRRSPPRRGGRRRYLNIAVTKSDDFSADQAGSCLNMSI